jgi:hypothetical protein
MTKIKKTIDNLRDSACFDIMEDFPEDFTESRTDWDDLADKYKTLYYALMEIEREVSE